MKSWYRQIILAGKIQRILITNDKFNLYYNMDKASFLNRIASLTVKAKPKTNVKENFGFSTRFIFNADSTEQVTELVSQKIYIFAIYNPNKEPIQL